MVAFDHAVEGLSIDRKKSGRCLLVSTGVFQHARDVSTFNL
jgi:hypothetical protein